MAAVSGGTASADPALAASRTGNAKALLHEILRMLDALVKEGQGGTVDLRSVPLTRGDLDYLRDALGTGAVDARIDALGESHVVETIFPGIWWVTHRNEAGEIVAESIEVCTIPVILVSPIDDMVDAVDRLRKTLATTAEQEP